ncbi:uncharacterized protein BDR25DRAFT_361737 [Lindgomyces ingoldianus]|uniref:Uncharacterized protein n=1 Tax=Lindgomyces ingoldianus TaxID=673940 RepID=A0ACB6QCA1_9PLEO|nr:uncharacterized protein BDR25DRAFT_361737 [Lindgomyces ingoldianus]KAF2464228.1 hypothetical protein BDR25DRAFT_361737 [Lindgomyces ingoldianus]
MEFGLAIDPPYLCTLHKVYLRHSLIWSMDLSVSQKLESVARIQLCAKHASTAHLVATTRSQEVSFYIYRQFAISFLTLLSKFESPATSYLHRIFPYTLRTPPTLARELSAIEVCADLWILMSRRLPKCGRRFLDSCLLQSMLGCCYEGSFEDKFEKCERQARARQQNRDHFHLPEDSVISDSTYLHFAFGHPIVGAGLPRFGGGCFCNSLWVVGSIHEVAVLRPLFWELHLSSVVGAALNRSDHTDTGPVSYHCIGNRHILYTSVDHLHELVLCAVVHGGVVDSCHLTRLGGRFYYTAVWHHFMLKKSRHGCIREGPRGPSSCAQGLNESQTRGSCACPGPLFEDITPKSKINNPALAEGERSRKARIARIRNPHNRLPNLSKPANLQVVCEEHEFKVRKTLLSSQSEYFWKVEQLDRESMYPFRRERSNAT